MSEFIFGIYDEKKNMIGYKADSFWSLTKKREYAKPDSLLDGKIRPHLVGNLESILKRKNDKGIVGIIGSHVAGRDYGEFETLLLGYEEAESDTGKPKSTHRIFPQEIQELDAEDIARLNA